MGAFYPRNRSANGRATSFCIGGTPMRLFASGDLVCKNERSVRKGGRKPVRHPPHTRPEASCSVRVNDMNILSAALLVSFSRRKRLYETGTKLFLA